MKKRSAIIIAGMPVSALLAGIVSREATLTRPTVALKPSAVVIQQPAPVAPAYQGEPNDY